MEKRKLIGYIIIIIISIPLFFWSLFAFIGFFVNPGIPSFTPGFNLEINRKIDNVNESIVLNYVESLKLNNIINQNNQITRNMEINYFNSETLLELTKWGNQEKKDLEIDITYDAFVLDSNMIINISELKIIIKSTTNSEIIVINNYDEIIPNITNTFNVVGYSSLEYALDPSNVSYATSQEIRIMVNGGFYEFIQIILLDKDFNIILLSKLFSEATN